MKKGLKGIVFLFLGIFIFSVFLSSGVWSAAACNNPLLGNTCTTLNPSCTCAISTPLYGSTYFKCVNSTTYTGIVNMYTGSISSSGNVCTGSLLSGLCKYNYTCPSGQVCSDQATTSGAGCVVGTIPPVIPVTPSPRLTGASFRVNSSPVDSLVVNREVNLTVGGSNLSAVGFLASVINYTIYNALTNSVFISFNHTAINDGYDIINWTPTIIGTYNFTATIGDGLGDRKVISSTLVVSSNVRSFNCSGNLFANAEWNSPSGNGNFTQTLDAGSVWIPASKTASYNETQGECNFKCASGYVINSAKTKCDLIPPAITLCPQLTQADCGSASNLVVKNTLVNFGRSEEVDYCEQGDKVVAGCTFDVLCKCKWNSTQGNCSEVNVTYVQKSDCNNKLAGNTPGSCIFSSTILQNNCANSLGTMLLRQSSSWIGSGAAINCSDKDVPYPCANTAKLPFTDYLGYLLIILLIAGVYSIKIVVGKSHK